MSLYLDTSGLVKILVHEPGSDQIVAEIPRHALHFTARVTYAEACAALGKAHRMERLTLLERDSCVHALATRWPNLVRVGLSEDVVRRGGDLAIRLGLRGYDAIHLACALQVAHVDDSLTFVAWDGNLRAAAEAMELDVFPARL